MKPNGQSLQDRRQQEIMEALSSISTDCVEGDDVPTRRILARNQGSRKTQRGEKKT